MFSIEMTANFVLFPWRKLEILHRILLPLPPDPLVRTEIENVIKILGNTGNIKISDEDTNNLHFQCRNYVSSAVSRIQVPV